MDPFVGGEQHMERHGLTGGGKGYMGLGHVGVNEERLLILNTE